jgi:hypothetical protein
LLLFSKRSSFLVFLKKRTKKLLFVLAFTPWRSAELDCHAKKMPNAIALDPLGTSPQTPISSVLSATTTPSRQPAWAPVHIVQKIPAAQR